MSRGKGTPNDAVREAFGPLDHEHRLHLFVWFLRQWKKHDMGRSIYRNCRLCGAEYVKNRNASPFCSDPCRAQAAVNRLAKQRLVAKDKRRRA